MSTPEYINLTNVLAFMAEHFGIQVTPRTWHRWHQQRRGPTRLRIGRQIVYRVSDLTAWVDSHQDPPRNGGRRNVINP